MDIDLVPVNESVPEAKAPEPLPNDEKMTLRKRSFKKRL